MPSVVWNYFAKTDAGPKCMLCHDLRRRRDSSTKTMWVHLKLKHFDVYQALRGQADRDAAPATTTNLELNSLSVPSSSISSSASSPDSLFSMSKSSAPMPPALALPPSYVPPIPFPSAPLFPVNNVFLESYLQLFRMINNKRKAAKEEAEVENIQNRYDLVSHWPERDQQRCCVACKGSTRVACKKCNVGLCVDCFKTFHLPARGPLTS